MSGQHSTRLFSISPRKRYSQECFLYFSNQSLSKRLLQNLLYLGTVIFVQSLFVQSVYSSKITSVYAKFIRMGYFSYFADLRHTPCHGMHSNLQISWMSCRKWSTCNTGAQRKTNHPYYYTSAGFMVVSKVQTVEIWTERVELKVRVVTAHWQFLRKRKHTNSKSTRKLPTLPIQLNRCSSSLTSKEQITAANCKICIRLQSFSSHFE